MYCVSTVPGEAILSAACPALFKGQSGIPYIVS